MLYTKLVDDDRRYLQDIRKWVICQEPSKTTSTHWWYKDLPTDVRHSFINIALSPKILDMFAGYRVNILDDMNEVYVSPPTNVLKNTSDEVFYTSHIDGPFYIFPFASCYRMIVGMDDNEEIATVFDLDDTHITLKEGDCLAFDFHRECHHIEKNTGAVNKSFRVVLKIHYCVYPNHMIARWFGKILGHMSIMYDKAFRQLFLYTIMPKTIRERIAACNVLFWTKLYYGIEAYIGYYNLVYLLMLWCLGNRDVWLIGTSFIHYMEFGYAGVKKYSIGKFVRDVTLYKLISDANLIWLYTLSQNRIDFQSIFMTMIGYLVSYGYIIENGLKKLYMNKHDYDNKVILQNIILHSILAYTGFFSCMENEKFYLIPMHILSNIVMLMI